MFDLYLFNTIVNVLWYLFTVLFVLYRYTTFFSYIYNFIRFCGKLFTGVSYIYKYINPVPQVDLEAQYLQENRNKRETIYNRCKGYIVKNYNYYYRKFFKQQGTINEYSELNAFPLTETNYGSDVNFSTQLHTSNEISKKRENNILKKRENDMFNKKMQELEHSELDVEYTNGNIKNENEFYDKDKASLLQDSNNYTFKIGETTSSLKVPITIEHLKSTSESIYNHMCNLDEFYENVDILPSNDSLDILPSNESL